MEIKEQNAFAKLSWSGTSLPLKAISCDGRLVFKAEPIDSQVEPQYFLQVGDLETLEHVINILNMVNPI